MRTALRRPGDALLPPPGTRGRLKAPRPPLTSMALRGLSAGAACLLLSAVPFVAALPPSTAPWGAWNVETVAFLESVFPLEGEGGIAIDGGGTPHVLTIISPTQGAHYSKIAGPLWSTELFERFSAFGSPSTDAAGDIHGTIHTEDRRTLSEVTWTDGGVEIDVIESLTPGNQVMASAIHFDGAGQTHITYGTTSGTLEYATRAGNSWVKETITTGWFHASAVDEFGGVHVAFERLDRVDYAYRAPTGGWTIEQVPSCYWYVSVAADSQGHPHVSCQNLTKGLVYMRHTGAAGWVEEVLVNPLATTLHATRDIGYQSDIALDGADRPHITFHNRNTFSSFDPTRGGSLTYAMKTSAGWAYEEIDRLEGNTGHASSIAIDEFDRPHVAYTRVRYSNSVPCLPSSLTCLDLKYATPVVVVPNDHGLGLV